MSLASKILRLIFRWVWHLTRARQLNYKAQRGGLEFWSSFLPKRRHMKYKVVQVGTMKGEWFIPDGCDQSKVLYYLHGGAYSMGSIHTHRRLIANIAHSAGIKALAVEYSLSPETVFPSALHQAVDGYKWLLAQGHASSDVVIGGDSAGGGLSVATLVQLRNQQIPLPKMAILLSPWTDVAGEGQSNKTADQRDPINNTALQFYGKMYAGNESVHHPLISPIYADLTGLPPMLVQVSTTELLYNDATRLAEKARECGVDITVQEYQGQVHVWQLFDFFVPEANKALAAIGEYVKRGLRG